MKTTIMYCPKCKSEKKIKNGFVKKVQRYQCKTCGYNYSLMRKSTAKSPIKKRRCLEMYLEGSNFHAISRILKVSHVSVMNWIRKYGEKAAEIKSENSVPIVEIDEMHSYIGSKKKPVGFGSLLTD